MILIALAAAAAAAAPPDTTATTEITVRASPVANAYPAGSFAALATELRYDPRIELQSRGLAEGQADITVRGGLFEGTGIRVGAVTIMDPQTGHYTAELPIDPAFLSAPRLLTGIDNAAWGLNSNVATIAYSMRQSAGSGAVMLGAGSDALRHETLRAGVRRVSEGATELAAAASVAFSSGDGSLANGDHDFARYNLQLQRASEAAQTDVLLAWQDKFYGWPGAYTGFATLPETDRTKTSLVLVNHRSVLDNGWLEIGAYRRRLEDDYDFDRRTEESGIPGAFDHETVVQAIGVQGFIRRGDLDWRYGGQLTFDELVRSTDLTNGDFDSRRYLKLSVVPSLELYRHGDSRVSLRAGLAFDHSSRDAGELSPLFGLTFERGTGFVEAQYAAASQVPGYTALKSGPSGLFGGNPDLGRETSRQLALSAGRQDENGHAVLTLFHRRDDDLVDWTYSRASPLARQANAVDAEVTGVEALFSHRWDGLQLAGGYTWIDKDADFGAASVDASFYALNYARHRATLAATWRWTDAFSWRVDSEYRVQRDNPLRTSRDNALFVSASIAWEPAPDGGLALAVIADNLADSDYQQFPGTPAVGRQLAVNLRYTW